MILKICRFVGQRHRVIRIISLEIKKNTQDSFWFALSQEDYVNSRFDQNTVGLDLGLRLKYPVDDCAYWYSNFTFTPSLEDKEDYRMEHESGINISLSGDHVWSLIFGVEHEYNSIPVVEVEELDTTYFSKLELKFLIF